MQTSAHQLDAASGKYRTAPHLCQGQAAEVHLQLSGRGPGHKCMSRCPCKQRRLQGRALAGRQATQNTVAYNSFGIKTTSWTCQQQQEKRGLQSRGAGRHRRPPASCVRMLLSRVVGQLATRPSAAGAGRPGTSPQHLQGCGTPAASGQTDC